MASTWRRYSNMREKTLRSCGSRSASRDRKEKRLTGRGGSELRKLPGHRRWPARGAGTPTCGKKRCGVAARAPLPEIGKKRGLLDAVVLNFGNYQGIEDGQHVAPVLQHAGKNAAELRLALRFPRSERKEAYWTRWF